jgi:hypothetical protein
VLFSFPINLLFWHVEAGIVMTVVSVFHLSWHIGYYRDLLRRGREGPRTTGRVETRDVCEAVSQTRPAGPKASPQNAEADNES